MIQRIHLVLAIAAILLMGMPITSHTQDVKAARWGIFFESIYFNDKSNEYDRLSFQDHSLLLGGQARYYIQPQFAVEAALKYSEGNMDVYQGTQKNIAAALSAVVYPIRYERFSPYFISGFSLVHAKMDYDQMVNEDAQKNHLIYFGGVGGEIQLVGNILASMNIRIIGESLKLVGWAPTFAIGYAF